MEQRDKHRTHTKKLSIRPRKNFYFFRSQQHKRHQIIFYFPSVLYISIACACEIIMWNVPVPNRLNINGYVCIIYKGRFEILMYTLFTGSSRYYSYIGIANLLYCQTSGCLFIIIVAENVYFTINAVETVYMMRHSQNFKCCQHSV